MFVLKEQFNNLQSGNPCPLCGSTTHPYKTNPHRTPNIQNKNHQHPIQKIIDYQDIIQQQKENIIKLGSHLDHLRQQLLESNETLQEMKQDCQQQQQILNQHLKHHNINPINVIDFNILNQLSCQYKKNIDNLKEQEKQYQNIKPVLSTTDNHIQELTHQFNKIEKENHLFNQELIFLIHKTTDNEKFLDELFFKANHIAEKIYQIKSPYHKHHQDTPDINRDNINNHQITKYLQGIVQYIYHPVALYNLRG